VPVTRLLGERRTRGAARRSRGVHTGGRAAFTSAFTPQKLRNSDGICIESMRETCPRMKSLRKSAKVHFSIDYGERICTAGTGSTLLTASMAILLQTSLSFLLEVAAEWSPFNLSYQSICTCFIASSYFAGAVPHPITPPTTSCPRTIGAHSEPDNTPSPHKSETFPSPSQKLTRKEAKCLMIHGPACVARLRGYGSFHAQYLSRG